jgi:hypothetical protein
MLNILHIITVVTIPTIKRQVATNIPEYPDDAIFTRRVIIVKTSEERKRYASPFLSAVNLGIFINDL